MYVHTALREQKSALIIAVRVVDMNYPNSRLRALTLGDCDDSNVVDRLYIMPCQSPFPSRSGVAGDHLILEARIGSVARNCIG